MQATNTSVNTVFENNPSSNYTLQAIYERLKPIYRTEIIRTIKEIDNLLPSYRQVADSNTYERDRTTMMLVAAYVSSEAITIRALAMLLNLLLEQRTLLIGAISQPDTKLRGFQLRDQVTGAVKAWTRMTQSIAENRNLQLGIEKSNCRWFPMPIVVSESEL